MHVRGVRRLHAVLAQAPGVVSRRRRRVLQRRRPEDERLDGGGRVAAEELVDAPRGHVVGGRRGARRRAVLRAGAGEAGGVRGVGRGVRGVGRRLLGERAVVAGAPRAARLLHVLLHDLTGVGAGLRGVGAWLGRVGAGLRGVGAGLGRVRAGLRGARLRGVGAPLRELALARHGAVAAVVPAVRRLHVVLFDARHVFGAELVLL